MHSIEFEVNGKTKRLRYDVNSIADIEDTAGVGVFSLISDQKRIGYSPLRILFWGGLKHEDKGITLDRAGLILKQLMDDGKTFDELYTLAIRALKISRVFPEAVADELEEALTNLEENPTKPGKPGTKTTS